MRRRRTSGEYFQPELTEAEIQRAVFQNLQRRGAPDLFAFHPANGGFRLPFEAAILKGLGVVPGVPDIIVVHKGRIYCLELKRTGGRLTTAQLEAQERLELAGATCAVAIGLPAALFQLEQWGLLRGRVQ